MAHAIVLAGGRLDGQFREEAGTEWKALAPVGGRPVLAGVLDALLGASVVDEIVAVGPESVREGAHWPAGVRWAVEGDSAPESLRIGLRGLGLVTPVIVASADLPFLTAEGVATLVNAYPAGVDIACPLIRSEEYRRAFPGSPVGEMCFRDGRFVWPGVVLAKPQAILMHYGMVLQAYAARRRPWQLVRLLGMATALRYLMGGLTTAATANAVTRRLAMPCLPLHEMPPELGFTLETAAHYQSARAHAAGETAGRR